MSTPGSFFSTAAHNSLRAAMASASLSMLSLNLASWVITLPLSPSAATASRLKPNVANPALAAQKALRDTLRCCAFMGETTLLVHARRAQDQRRLGHYREADRVADGRL